MDYFQIECKGMTKFSDDKIFGHFFKVRLQIYALKLSQPIKEAQ